jgi:hypothetical protein
MNRLMEWWRVEGYGSVNPSRGRRIAATVVFGSLLLVPYGLGTDFVPSALVAKVGLYLSAAMSLAFVLFAAHGVATGRFERDERQGRLSYVLGFVGIYCLIWPVLVRAVPDILTRMFGSYESRSIVMEARYERTRSCDHQLRGEELVFPGYICVPDDEVGRYAPLGEVILSGPSTKLGLHVSHIEPGSPRK